MTDRDAIITCDDCIHNEICETLWQKNRVPKIFACQCGCFKEKTKYVEMPLRVGQAVWFIRNKTEVIATAVEKIILKHGGLYIKLCHNSMYETTCRSIGKTVFLTREDAERALEECEGK